MIAAFSIALVLLVCWIAWGRSWLKARPWRWSQWLFSIVEPAERWLWNKSKTILWSRFLMLLGALPWFLDQIQLLNIPALLAVIPAGYQSYISLVFVVIGIISEIIRRYTTKPLALVELPDNAPFSVTQAVAVAEIAEADAVAAVRQAKAEGTV